VTGEVALMMYLAKPITGAFRAASTWALTTSSMSARR